jgi:hypothetical protein
MAYLPIPMSGRPTFQTMTAGPTNPFAPPNAVADWWANGGSEPAGNALQMSMLASVAELYRKVAPLVAEPNRTVH